VVFTRRKRHFALPSGGAGVRWRSFRGARGAAGRTRGHGNVVAVAVWHGCGLSAAVRTWLLTGEFHRFNHFPNFPN
jgi:hypothetical protein